MKFIVLIYENINTEKIQFFVLLTLQHRVILFSLLCLSICIKNSPSEKFQIYSN